MATLSEIIDVRMSIEDMLYESGGEVTEEIEEALALSEGALESKIDGYYSVINKMNYGSEEIDKEIARLQALKKTKQNAVKNLKERLLYYMAKADIQRVEGTLCKVYRKNNAPSVVVENESDLYVAYAFDYDALVEKLPSYIKLTMSLDKTKLKETLKGGQEVSGCKLESSQSVVFK